MKKVNFSIGSIDLGTYNLIDGDVLHTATVNGLMFYTNSKVEMIHNEQVHKLVA